VGALYDARVKIEAIIKEKNLSESQVKGAIGLKSGVLLALIQPDTPDDAAKLDKLKAAVKEVLQTIM
jgi:hypothetical protein